mmetsp:Transcript_3978/g.5384  ORF Transcript_3978/g.5384 Transcript_3978/m.5384 type:complete len:138 (-) Transcript_3978:159-572(-)
MKRREDATPTGTIQLALYIISSVKSARWKKTMMIWVSTKHVQTARRQRSELVDVLICNALNAKSTGAGCVEKDLERKKMHQEKFMLISTVSTMEMKVIGDKEGKSGRIICFDNYSLQEKIIKLYSVQLAVENIEKSI